jgi:hypothetical protein
MSEYDDERELERLIERSRAIYWRLSPQRRRRFRDEFGLFLDEYEAETPDEEQPAQRSVISCPCCGESLTVSLACNP